LNGSTSASSSWRKSESASSTPARNAQRHRQADRLPQERRADHHEKCSGGEYFTPAEARDGLQKRADQQATRDDDERNRGDAFRG
jgi:hypothetical protein